MKGPYSDGKWHCYEINIKMDTNSENGISEAWIDGKKILSNKNVDFGTVTGWKWFQIDSNQKKPRSGRCMAVSILMIWQLVTQDTLDQSPAGFRLIHHLE